jgi:hypothetical protein
LAFGPLVLGAASTPGWAADSGLNLSIHANSRATSSKVGLPDYPGAKLDTDDRSKDDDDASTDLGFTFGNFQFAVVRVAYVTSDSAQQVLDFYRKAMATYGDVLECANNKPVGKPTATRTGLTCDNDHGNVQINSSDSSTSHELRAGSPRHFRVVGLEDSSDGRTHFQLVLLKLPKDD